MVQGKSGENWVHGGRALACLLIVIIATIPLAAQTPYGLHVWDTPVDPSVFEKRINEQLDLAQKSVSQLLAISGPRTVQNTLGFYDDAVQHRDTAGYQSGLTAEDFFRQFNRNDPLASEVGLRYRSTVLEKAGSRPANDLVRSVLARPQALEAFKGWMNQVFQGMPTNGTPSEK